MKTFLQYSVKFAVNEGYWVNERDGSIPVFTGNKLRNGAEEESGLLFLQYNINDKSTLMAALFNDCVNAADFSFIVVKKTFWICYCMNNF